MTKQADEKSIVDRILAGEVPAQVRAAAARGALPLPRATLVRLFLLLREDDDETIRADAEASLSGLEANEIQEVLEDPECAAEVLDHYAVGATRDETLAERIVFHHSVPAAALVKLAAGGNAAVIELVLTNQERLLKQPDLLTCLSLNPALRADQRGRILELLERTSQAVARAEGAGEESDAGEQEEISEELLEAAKILELDIGELYSASEIQDSEEFEFSEDPEIRTAYQKIITLDVAQKAVLAMRGGREERMILVRDTNKLVALGVLRNPRIQEDDVESIARMRNVSDEVLRYIGQSREWTKNYSLVMILVNNPRTPQGISTNFVTRLQNQDLKKLSGSREVPELIRRMAKRTFELRTARRK